MKTILATAALAVTTLCASVPATATPVLTFTATANHINIDGNTTITATLSGLGADILSSYDVTCIYDASVLHWGLAIFPSNLGNSVGITPSLVEGALGFKDATLDTDAVLAATQPDSFTLGTFLMEEFANGFTNFTLAAAPAFTTLANATGIRQPLTVDVGSTCISVGTGACPSNTVPEPGILAIMAIALAGFRLGRSKTS